MSIGVKMREAFRRSLLALLSCAVLAHAWLAAAAPAAAAGGDAELDRYQVERQLVELLKKLQDKHQHLQAAPAAAAAYPSAGTAANSDRFGGGGDEESAAAAAAPAAAAAYDRADDADATPPFQPQPQLPFRGVEARPANVVRNPEGRSAYTNRCRGDSRMCMSSYRIGAKRDEPSNSDLVPALEALSDDEQQPPAPDRMYRTERRMRLELIKRKLLDLYDDVRELEREYAT